MSDPRRSSGNPHQPTDGVQALVAFGLLAILLGIGAVYSAATYDPDAPMTCGSEVMGPGDTCITRYSGGAIDEDTDEERNANRGDLPHYVGPLLLAIGAFLIVAPGLRARGRGRGPTTTRPAPPPRAGRYPVRTPPEPPPRGGEVELARSRELLVAARSRLNDDIERLSQFRGDHRQQLVEETGTIRGPGMVSWPGADRLYEVTSVEPVDWDRPEWGDRTVRSTPGYFFSYATPALSGPRTYLTMTVSAESAVELAGPPPSAGRPATGEELERLLGGRD